VSGATEQVLSFSTEAPGLVDGDLRLYEVTGEESLSAPYRYRLRLSCALEGGISPDVERSLFMHPCSFTFGSSGGRRVSGVPRSVRMLPLDPSGSTEYELVIVPRLWLSSLGCVSRIFQEQSFPEILSAVLSGSAGLAEATDFELRLTEGYESREYVVQYQESDFNFLSRWMEHYGIFYLFEQTDAGEKVVFTDNHSELIAVPGHEQVGYEHGGIGSQELPEGAVTELSRFTEQRPAKVHLREYNWRGPSYPVANAAIDSETGLGLVGLVGEHFKDESEGAVLARVRAEERVAHSGRHLMSSTTCAMSAGHHLSVSGAPIGDLDLKYLLVSVRHYARQTPGSASGGTYHNELEAIDFALPFRPLRTTERPRIRGIVNGRIDGVGGSTAAPVDEQGRYRVAMFFNMSRPEVGQGSRWVRMAQASAGPEYGMHFPLHVGTEVLLSHIDGDPDRPIIVGAVPNPRNAQRVQNERATRSMVRTRSGIEIDFEDDAIV
jgi:type VI secretion system secreted protein VgrG